MVSPAMKAGADVIKGGKHDKVAASASKRALKRQRKKLSLQERRLIEASMASSDDMTDGSDCSDVVVTYITEKLDLSEPLVEYFGDVFERFSAKGVPVSSDEPEVIIATPKDDDDESVPSDDDDDATLTISQRQLKRLNRPTVSDLKQTAQFPEVVDVHDVSAHEPRLLIELKSVRNSVPVPCHWSQKRKYLQGKRGQEKTLFKLPDFIEATGIGAMRQAQIESDKDKKAKSKQRERMQPKMNRIDIDYQVLHDAFFRNQPVKKTTKHGDIYFEGKEFQINVKSAKPGCISPALREALGIREGFPPPWLINMQRFGPPPSYRNLKIPGLNAPLPPGASYGYGDGQWGKPPVDHLGNPMYGDPFGMTTEQILVPTPISNLDPWGDLAAEEEEPEEEIEHEEMEEEEDESGLQSVASSVASGLTTPDTFDLRKGPVGLETPEIDLRKQPSKQLYQVLDQKEIAVGDALYGSSHTYKVPVASSASAAVASQLNDGRIELSLAPEELENLDAAGLARRYQEKVEAVRGMRSTDDVSDVILEETRKRKRKEDAKKQPKKLKEFKF